jgi:iron complex outermembrane receptor protein
MRSVVFCCAAIIELGVSFAAAAQQTTSGENSGDLQEIVVSAQRRAERLQDVPITITNITSDQLTDANVKDLSNIQQLTPALRFDNNGQFFQPTIRGVGNAVVSTGGTGNVGIYIDGFYSPNPAEADTQLLNVASIQVLKGPQGTLFGRNTTGGAILVNTLKPSETTSAIVDATYGSFNAQRYQGYLTTGLFDYVAMDVAATFSKGDGYLTNIVTGDDKVGAYENWSVRTGLKADLSDNISVLLRYMHEQTNDPSAVDGNIYVLNGQPLTSLAVIPGAIYATKPSEVAYRAGSIPSYTANNDIVQLTLTFDLGFGTLSSYSQYRRENGNFVTGILGSLPGVNASVGINYDKTITQEFLLTSKPGTRLQWTAGAFYFDYTDPFRTTLSIFGAPFIPGPGSGTDTVSGAVFADATYQLAEKFYITAGARYTHDAVKDAYMIEFPTETRVSHPDISGSRVLPRAVVRYTPGKNSSLYASFTRGYKAGIYDLGGVQAVPVAPESMSAYEVGYKYAAQAWSLDLASYYYDYSDLQVSSYAVDPITHVGIAQIRNAADAHIYGFEGAVRYAVLRDLDLNAGAAYTHARYTSFPNAPSYTPCFSLPACGPNYGTLIPGTIDASGLEMQRAPEVTASAGARYIMDLARGRLALSGNLYYTSGFWFEASHLTYQSAYTTLQLRAQWTNPSGRFTFAVYGNNVTDKRYLVRAQSGNTGVGAGWNAPATVGGEILVHLR